MKRYSIGIDPGTKTGVAVYDRHLKKVTRLECLNFVSALRLIKSEYAVEDVYAVVIEVSNSNHVWKDNSSLPIRVRLNVALKVGGVAKESELIAAMLMEHGYSVTTQHPSGKGKSMDHNRFNKLTGWKGKSNEHTRDAGMLCFGV